jgi:hypothetical protein
LQSRTAIQIQKLRIRIGKSTFFDIHFEFCKATEQQSNKPTKQQNSKAAKHKCDWKFTN